MSVTSPTMSRRWRVALIISSICALVWSLIARVLGPSDLWDQTQIKTVSYTTDIIVQGGSHWFLPIERGELPATKPPLYNWLAVPFVKWLGFDSEIAHKLPSVAALLACWVIIVRLGNSLEHNHTAGSLRDPGRIELRPILGWLASLIFIANPMTFKLGYLARPDMLLTLWLTIAWACATKALVRAGVQRQPVPRFAGGAEGHESHTGPTSPPESRAREAPQGARATVDTTLRLARGAPGFSASIPASRRVVAPVIFWLAVTLAALTKGPSTIVVIVYAGVAARVISGRWGAIRALHPIIGLLLCVLLCGAWVYAVWKINPQHLRQELWFNEIYGRITGIGEEGTHHGERRLLMELPYQSFYFVTRFAPWSIVAAIGAVAVMRRGRPDRGQTKSWMHGAALQVIITTGLYSLSVGKRADYIASAIPPASLLVAWWLVHRKPHFAIRWPWCVPTTAAIILLALTWHNQRETSAPARGFGEAILAFARDANRAIAGRPAPVVTFAAGQTHLQAMMGIVGPDARHSIPDLVPQAEPFWVVAGRIQNPPNEFDQWVAQRGLKANCEAVVRSPVLPREHGWPEQVTLWRVTPARRDLQPSKIKREDGGFR